MNKFSVITVLALVGCVLAEPPSGYSYKRPSFGGGHGPVISHGPSFSGSLGGFDGGFHGGAADFHGGSAGFDGGYSAVSAGYQTSEGLHVDPLLLHKVKQILLDQENLHGSGGFHGGHGGHGLEIPSSSYGVPSTSYGVPSYSTRVVGIELGQIRQGAQVAQYHQQSHGPSFGHSGPSFGHSGPSFIGGGGGHSSGISFGGHSSGSSSFGHSGPSFGIGQSISSSHSFRPSRPSHSYGPPPQILTAPSGSYGPPSGSYGPPGHHH